MGVEVGNNRPSTPLLEIGDVFVNVDIDVHFLDEGGGTDPCTKFLRLIEEADAELLDVGLDVNVVLFP